MIEIYDIKDFFETPVKLTTFHINRLADMPKLPATIVSPHQHTFVEIFLLLDGSMEHNVDFNQYSVQPSNLFFISQGQYHIWSKASRKTLSGFRLMFEESLVQNLMLEQNFLFELVYLNNVYQNPLVPICLEKDQRLIQYFELLHQEYQRHDCNLKAIQANLFLLLLEIQRITYDKETDGGATYHLSVYQKFSALVKLHFSQQSSIAWYASQLNISTAQLNRIVTKFSKLSIGKFLQQRRILESKRLLATSTLSVREIAFMIGIEDPSYFIRAFKKSENTTPQEFRSKM